MARFAFGLVTGFAVATVFGAALGIHSQETSRDIQEAAAAAQVDPVALAGAVNTTGLDPWLYLRGVGELASPSSTPPRVDPPPGVWDVLARCESTSNWSAVSPGGTYRGGLQFDLPTWRAYGGTGLPNQASRAEQIRVAERLRAVRGFAPWPVCSRVLGLR